MEQKKDKTKKEVQMNGKRKKTVWKEKEKKRKTNK